LSRNELTPETPLALNRIDREAQSRLTDTLAYTGAMSLSASGIGSAPVLAALGLVDRSVIFWPHSSS
jgi:hypothetical protein